MRTLLRATMLCAVLSAGAVALSGCSTTQAERSKRTATGLNELRELLEKGDRQVVALNGAVESVMKAEPAKLRAACAAFDKELARARKLASRAQAEVGDIKGNASAYFKVWEQQAGKLENSSLKAMSQERRAALQQDYNRTLASLERVGAAYDPYARDMADLQVFLGNDLTKAGSELAKPHLAKVLADAAPARSALADALVQVKALAAVLAPK